MKWPFSYFEQNRCFIINNETEKIFIEAKNMV